MQRSCWCLCSVNYASVFGLTITWKQQEVCVLESVFTINTFIFSDIYVFLTKAETREAAR